MATEKRIADLEKKAAADLAKDDPRRLEIRLTWAGPTDYRYFIHDQQVTRAEFYGMGPYVPPEGSSEVVMIWDDKTDGHRSLAEREADADAALIDAGAPNAQHLAILYDPNWRGDRS
jgi:hypothetical protein